MGDLVVASGAVGVILGGLLLGLAADRGRWRNACLTLGWLMVIFGVSAEAVAVVQSAGSNASAEQAAPQ